VPGTEFSCTMIGGVPVVATPEEIDITRAGVLREVLLEATSRRRWAVVVDMSATLFCDSSGLHALLRAHKRALSEGHELRLVIPADGAVPRLMTLTGIDSIIPCYPSQAEALSRPVATL
jgi:anti-sigma B factor antagonist